MDLSPEVEARFIEQEHRIVRVVQNYFDRTKWPADDPRRAAARNAVIWRVLAPGTAAVAASGIIALATLGVLVWQTELIAEQNKAFKEQNFKLQLQIDQQADQDTSRRRTEIIAALYETQVDSQGILQPRANPRTRAEAVLEFVQLERSRLKKLKTRVPAYQGELSLTQARLDGLNLDNADLQDMVLIGAFLQNTSFSDSDLRRADLGAALMQGTSFRQANLQRANFEGSALLQVTFARSDLRWADLSSVSIRGCEFLGADLRRAKLTGLKDWAENANLRFANIAGAEGLSPEAREHFLKQGAVEMPDEDQWSTFKRNTFRTAVRIER